MPLIDIIAQLKYRREQLRVIKKLPNKGKKQPVWRHPINVERQYNRFLQQYITELKVIVDNTIVQHIPSLLEQRNALSPTRVDDWADDAERLIAQSKVGFDSTQANIPDGISRFAGKTNVWNDVEWQKQLKAALGVNVFQREPWLNETLNSFSKENITLIKSMSDDYLSKVDGSVQRGVRQGQSLNNIRKDIQTNTATTRKRAKLIARDQVSKLNGQLTELRQTNIGIKKYIWIDSDDTRVRQTHKSNDGQTFSWVKPPTLTGHPGQDVQCRCWAEPIFDDIVAELKDEEIIPKPLSHGTVTKQYKTKASAQSQKSRIGNKLSTINYNSQTGKWDLTIPNIGKTPVVTPITPTPSPITIAPKPIIAPPVDTQSYVIKSYKTKASAQSQKSRKFKTSTLQFNSISGKWELKIPTGTTVAPPPIPKPPKSVIPKSKPKPIQVSRAPSAESNTFKVFDKKGRPKLEINGKKRSLIAVKEDILKSGKLPVSVEKNIRITENKIRFKNYENGGFAEPDIGIIHNIDTQKKAHSVMIGGWQEDMVITHNHPTGFSFSGADLYNSHVRGRLQIRVTSEKKLYTMTRKSGSGTDWITKTDAKKYYKGKPERFLKDYKKDIQLNFNRANSASILEAQEQNISAFSRLGREISTKHSIKAVEEVSKKYADRHGWKYTIEDL